MSVIDKAIEDLESREPGEQWTYHEVSDKPGCSRSALSRRWRGISRDKNTKCTTQQALTPQQELELVDYIHHLTVNGLPPTREMVQNFASYIAHEELSKS